MYIVRNDNGSFLLTNLQSSYIKKDTDGYWISKAPAQHTYYYGPDYISISNSLACLLLNTSQLKAAYNTPIGINDWSEIYKKIFKSEPTKSLLNTGKDSKLTDKERLAWRITWYQAILDKLNETFKNMQQHYNDNYNDADSKTSIKEPSGTTFLDDLLQDALDEVETKNFFQSFI